MKKLTTTQVVQRPLSVQTYPVIPPTKEIMKQMALQYEDGKFRLFGTGNEKRDLVLLLRGDIRLLQTADTSFFGCVNCGCTTRTPYFRKSGEAYCHRCDCEGTVYSFDGVYKNVHARIQIGYNDSQVIITKL